MSIIFRPNQECQKIFQAKHPIDTDQAKAKLTGKMLVYSSAILSSALKPV